MTPPLQADPSFPGNSLMPQARVACDSLTRCTWDSPGISQEMSGFHRQSRQHLDITHLESKQRIWLNTVISNDYTHVQGFQPFSACLHHFVLAKLATSSIRIK